MNPRWLTALQRVRDHRRDLARQSLAIKRRLADELSEIATRTAAEAERAAKALQRYGQSGVLSIERMKEIRDQRAGVASRFAVTLERQAAADEAVQQAGKIVARLEAESE